MTLKRKKENNKQSFVLLIGGMRRSFTFLWCTAVSQYFGVYVKWRDYTEWGTLSKDSQLTRWYHTRGMGLMRLSLPMVSSSSGQESPHRRLLMVRTQSTITLTFIPDCNNRESVSFITRHSHSHIWITLRCKRGLQKLCEMNECWP